ncbi:MAG: hypothetical protein KDE46_23280, partial [Caldilineaceae bacterium]|nr:hypothetical protein [Caldilineaceae bacterium]
MDNPNTPPTSDQIYGQIGDNAQNVVIGAHVHQEIHTHHQAGAPRQGYSQFRTERTVLYGRAPLLADIIDAIQQHRRCVLTGLPGAGKSALALVVLADLRLTERFGRRRFGLVFGQDADLFQRLGLLLENMGIAPSQLESVDQRAAALRHQLHSGPTLLVLDDVWQLAHIQPILEACHPHHTHYLLTTRRGFLVDDLAGLRLDANPLDASASLELLADGGNLAAAALHADPEGARQLAEEANHLPLALEILGRQLNREASSEGLTRAVQILLADLRRSYAYILHLRASRRRSGLDEAEPSLEAVIDLSIAALAEENTRRAFTQLAVFGPEPLSFDAAALQAVWQTDEPSARRLRQDLMDAGLLQVVPVSEPFRYSTHQLLNRFAQYRLEADANVARTARLTHAAHYAQIVAGWDDAISQERMTYAAPLEWEQVAQAVEWLCATTLDDPGDAETAQGLLAYSRHWRNVIYNNHDPRRSHWLECAVQSAQRHSDDLDRANVLQAQGDVLAFLDQRQDALAKYDLALDLFRQVG